jgi:cytidylate kinase
MSPTSDHVVATLAQLHSYVGWQPDPKSAAPPITIAISRQAGAGGAAAAQAVAAMLGWPVYDHELLSRIAAEKGLQPRLLENVDERSVGWLEEALGSFVTQAGPLEGTYLKCLLQLLASLGKAGHCVIVGRGAAQVMPRKSTLRVRLVAPRAVRVAEVRKRFGWSQVEAEHWVDRTDAERDRFVRRSFRKDSSDPLNYDLTLNSARYSTDECARLIVQAARLLEAQIMAASAI